jgi:hypothetical protein
MWTSRFTDFQIDKDTSKPLFSSVVNGSEVRSGDDPQYGAPPHQCPGSEVGCAWISRLTNFRIDQDTSKALFSSVIHASEVRSGASSMADFGTTTLKQERGTEWA